MPLGCCFTAESTSRSGPFPERQWRRSFPCGRTEVGSIDFYDRVVPLSGNVPAFDPERVDLSQVARPLFEFLVPAGSNGYVLLVKSDTSLVYGDRHMLVLVSVDSVIT